MCIHKFAAAMMGKCGGWGVDRVKKRERTYFHSTFQESGAHVACCGKYFCWHRQLHKRKYRCWHVVLHAQLKLFFLSSPLQMWEELFLEIIAAIKIGCSKLVCDSHCVCYWWAVLSVQFENVISSLLFADTQLDIRDFMFYQYFLPNWRALQGRSLAQCKTARSALGL